MRAVRSPCPGTEPATTGRCIQQWRVRDARPVAAAGGAQLMGRFVDGDFGRLLLVAVRGVGHVLRGRGGCSGERGLVTEEGWGGGRGSCRCPTGRRAAGRRRAAWRGSRAWYRSVSGAVGRKESRPPWRSAPPFPPRLHPLPPAPASGRSPDALFSGPSSVNPGGSGPSWSKISISSSSGPGSGSSSAAAASAFRAPSPCGNAPPDRAAARWPPPATAARGCPGAHLASRDRRSTG